MRYDLGDHIGLMLVAVSAFWLCLMFAYTIGSYMVAKRTTAPNHITAAPPVT